MSFDRQNRKGDYNEHSLVLAEDLKLAEFILTKPEDRSKRKGDDELSSEKNGDNVTNDEYEESEEELAMIMKKGNII